MQHPPVPLLTLLFNADTCDGVVATLFCSNGERCLSSIRIPWSAQANMGQSTSLTAVALSSLLRSAVGYAVCDSSIDLLVYDGVMHACVVFAYVWSCFLQVASGDCIYCCTIIKGCPVGGTWVKLIVYISNIGYQMMISLLSLLHVLIVRCEVMLLAGISETSLGQPVAYPVSVLDRS